MANTVQLQYYNDFSSKMSLLQSSGRFCDVKICVDKEVFNCHRNVLSAASEYFNAMFNGNFWESSAKEVVLKGVDARVFKVLVEYMYTGDAEINIINVFDVVRAAEFYKLPFLVDHCAQFIERNLNALVEDILQMYLYAREADMGPIKDLLGRHIYRNFTYFANTGDFPELPFEGFLEILELVREEKVVPLQDPFLEGIRRWLALQVNLTAEEKDLYADKLFQRVNLAKLSFKYPRKYFYPEDNPVKDKELFYAYVSGEDIPAVKEDQKMLYAYVSTGEMAEGPSVTSVFTAYGRKHEWIYAGEVAAASSCGHMENVIAEGRIYSMRYSRGAPSPHTFISSSEASLYPFNQLCLPPSASATFDLCCSGNNIFMYNKYLVPDDGASRHILDAIDVSADGYLTLKPRQRQYPSTYSYERNRNLWFSLPCPKFEFLDSSMTCDEERLYLIGGSNSNKLVQAYDPRTSKWELLPSTANHYGGGATSLLRGENIFIYDATNPFPICAEIYNVKSGESQPFPSIPNSTPFPFQPLDKMDPLFVNLPLTDYAADFIVCCPKKVTLNSLSFCYNETFIPDWDWDSSLYDAVRDSKLECENIRLLNLMVF